MSDSQSTFAPGPQVANPFLEPQAQQLAFQEHNLGYQQPSGNIGPSTTAASFPQAPGGSAAPDFAAVPMSPPGGNPGVTRVGFLSLEPYKRYFNVDTEDVLYRLRLACVPIGSRFMDTVQENPDLYGPFWVAATLVFLAAASGNLSTYFSYLRQLRTNPAASFSYDVTKVSLSAALFFGYITIIPIMWYVALRYWGSPTSPTALVSLYGYSLATFLPISVACIVPLDAVRWPIVLVGGACGALFLMLNLRRLMDSFTDRKRKSIVLGMAGAGQLGLAVALKLYFFAFKVSTTNVGTPAPAYSPPPPSTPMPSTPPSS